MFLCLGEVYFTANGPRNIIDGSISIIFSHKEHKEEQYRCFTVNFAEILRTPFFKNNYGACF